MVTYAIKGNEKILVTPENKDSLVGYKFVQEEISEKTKDILKYLEIEKKSVSLKSQYLTAEMMPESVLKEKKLAKLIERGDSATLEFNDCIAGLILNYGEEILDELI